MTVEEELCEWALPALLAEDFDYIEKGDALKLTMSIRGNRKLGGVGLKYSNEVAKALIKVFASAPPPGEKR